jgi:hypothetical protein
MPSINNTFFRGMTGCIVVKFMKLETARAWALKDFFEHFWTLWVAENRSSSKKQRAGVAQCVSVSTLAVDPSK